MIYFSNIYLKLYNYDNIIYTRNFNNVLDYCNLIDFKEISKLDYINIFIVNLFPNKPWDWDLILEKISIYHLKSEIVKKFSLEIIEKYNNQWNYKYLSKNPNITEEYILKHPDKNWDIEYLIKNNKIDIKKIFNFKSANINCIKLHPNGDWDYKFILNQAHRRKKINNAVEIINLYK